MTKQELEQLTIHELRKLATKVNLDDSLLFKYFAGPYTLNKKKVWVSALLDHFRREKRLAKVG